LPRRLLAAPRRPDCETPQATGSSDSFRQISSLEAQLPVENRRFDQHGDLQLQLNQAVRWGALLAVRIEMRPHVPRISDLAREAFEVPADHELSDLRDKAAQLNDASVERGRVG
jgi:hypothetical protein